MENKSWCRERVWRLCSRTTVKTLLIVRTSKLILSCKIFQRCRVRLKWRNVHLGSVIPLGRTKNSCSQLRVPLAKVDQGAATGVVLSRKRAGIVVALERKQIRKSLQAIRRGKWANQFNLIRSYHRNRRNLK